MGPKTNSDNQDQTDDTLTSNPVASTSGDMPSMTPDPVSSDTSGIDIIPNADSPLSSGSSSDMPSTSEAPIDESSAMTSPAGSSMPEGSDMPSMTPVVPTSPQANINDAQLPSDNTPTPPANPLGVTNPTNSAQIPSATPSNKKNNTVIIITSAILVVLLGVLVFVFLRTKN